jgi:hypothetical protein
VRPVDAQFPVSQEFGTDATEGVPASANPDSGTAYLVYLYGNYQPYGHAGQDIACPIGTPVHAMAAGAVIWADWGSNLPGDDSDAGYRQRWYLYKNFPGIVTLIQHDGWISMYGHLSSNEAAPVGTVVAEGQLIGLSGNTKAPGVTLGAHLHVGALVDLSFSSGGGLIYGCTDPDPYYNSGAITAQGTITPVQEDDMSADTPFVSKDGASVTLQELLNSIDSKVDAALAAAQVGASEATNAKNNAADAAGRVSFAYANLPGAVLGFNYRPGANLAGAIDAIHAAPGTTAAVDIDALVSRLKAELPAAVLSELTAKLSQ